MPRESGRRVSEVKGIISGSQITVPETVIASGCPDVGTAGVGGPDRRGMRVVFAAMQQLADRCRSPVMQGAQELASPRRAGALQRAPDPG